MRGRCGTVVSYAVAGALSRAQDAMASFVKGASANEELERIVGLFWMLAWHLEIRVWFEWVDSDSNWSDDGAEHGLHRDVA